MRTRCKNSSEQICDSSPGTHLQPLLAPMTTPIVERYSLIHWYSAVDLKEVGVDLHELSYEL